MSILGFLRGRWLRWRAYRDQIQSLQPPVDREQLKAALDDWSRSLREPTAYYLDCYRYFHHVLSKDLRAHRTYFTENRRGFGEDAFHTMWWMLFERFDLNDFLEIGVYRGQSLSLASLLQQKTGKAGRIVGISPFSSAGDSVSRYLKGIDYYEDTLENFRHFALPEPTLVRAYSTDSAAIEAICSREWDCVYIDGNHDYEVAKADWLVCSRQTRRGGLVVLDDSALGTSYNPPRFATGGHPGPSRLAAEINPEEYRELLRVGHNRVFQRL